jgi:hypothetical protein
LGIRAQKGAFTPVFDGLWRRPRVGTARIPFAQTRTSERARAEAHSTDSAYALASPIHKLRLLVS